MQVGGWGGWGREFLGEVKARRRDIVSFSLGYLSKSRRTDKQYHRAPPFTRHAGKAGGFTHKDPGNLTARGRACSESATENGKRCATFELQFHGHTFCGFGGKWCFPVVLWWMTNINEWKAKANLWVLPSRKKLASQVFGVSICSLHLGNDANLYEAYE